MGLFDFGIDTEVSKEDEREQDLTQSFVNGLQSAFGLNAKNVAGAIDWSAMMVTSALNPMSDDNKYYKSFKNSSFGKYVDEIRNSGKLIIADAEEKQKVLLENNKGGLMTDLSFGIGQSLQPRTIAINIGGAMIGGFGGGLLSQFVNNPVTKASFKYGGAMLIEALTNGVDNVLIENDIKLSVYGRKLTPEERKEQFELGALMGAGFFVFGDILGRSAKGIKNLIVNKDVSLSNIYAKVKDIDLSSTSKFIDSVKSTKNKTEIKQSVKEIKTQISERLNSLKTLEQTDEVIAEINAGEETLNSLNSLLKEDLTPDELVEVERVENDNKAILERIQAQELEKQTMLNEKVFNDTVLGREKSYIKPYELSEFSKNFLKENDKEFVSEILQMNEKLIDDRIELKRKQAELDSELDEVLKEKKWYEEEGYIQHTDPTMIDLHLKDFEERIEAINSKYDDNILELMEKEIRIQEELEILGAKDFVDELNGFVGKEYDIFNEVIDYGKISDEIKTFKEGMMDFEKIPETQEFKKFDEEFAKEEVEKESFDKVLDEEFKEVKEENIMDTEKTAQETLEKFNANNKENEFAKKTLDIAKCLIESIGGQ